MTRLASIIVVAAVIGAAAGRLQADPPSDQPGSRWVDRGRLLTAMRQVESAGNDYAVGDHGRSRGPYQIQRRYWVEACRFGGVRWSYDELVWSEMHARQVVAWYWRLHRAYTDEARARWHNGGPGWRDKPATVLYWHRVQAAMRPQRHRS